ncbi:hypothetical protein JCM10450v2_003431 [Rhodotorula kratochvilovae]
MSALKAELPEAPTPAASSPALSRSTSHTSFPSAPQSPYSSSVQLGQLQLGDGEGVAGQELAPYDRGRQAWGFVAASFVLECFIWGYSYCYATVLVYLRSHDPWQKFALSSLSAIGTTQLGIQLMAPLFIIVIFRRYPDWVRIILWTALVVNCGSMFVSSWATDVWQLILLQGVLGGTSGAILYTPVFLWVNEWFIVRRGLAWGIIQAGTGTGGFVFPWVLDALLANLGFRWMCRIWAGITLVVFSVSISFVHPRIPLAVHRGNRGPWIPRVNWRFLRTPVFLLFSACCLFSALSWMPVSIYLATYANAFSTSTTTTNLVVGLLNLFASIGAALSGLLSDYSYPAANVISGVGAAVVSLCAWGFADSLAKTIVFVALFGIVSQQVATWSGATRDLAAQDPMTSTLIVTLFSVVRGVASLVMPAVSDALYNQGAAMEKGTWGRFGFEKMIAFVGINGFLLALCGLAVGWASRAQARKRRASFAVPGGGR